MPDKYKTKGGIGDDKIDLIFQDLFHSKMNEFLAKLKKEEQEGEFSLAKRRLKEIEDLCIKNHSLSKLYEIKRVTQLQNEATATTKVDV